MDFGAKNLVVTPESGASPTVTCTITWNNSAGDEVCATNGGDNLIADPQFCGVPGSHDYHLHASSLAKPSNKACMQRIGVHDEGCTTQIDATTWGRIKTRYR